MYNKSMPKNSKYPFIIEADPLIEDTAYQKHFGKKAGRSWSRIGPFYLKRRKTHG